MQPCSVLIPWPSLFGVVVARLRGLRNSGHASVVSLGFFCPQHGKPPAKKPKLSKELHPKPKFMDGTTEHKLLSKLDNAKCKPKFPQASSLGARRSLIAMLGAKGKNAPRFTRASTAIFEFRNRRRARADLVAVEGLDNRGMTDVHVKKPRVKKRQGQTKPHSAEVFVDSGHVGLLCECETGLSCYGTLNGKRDNNTW